MPKIKKENYCMDFFKGIACIMVIFVHAVFPGHIGTALARIGLSAVPFFMLISGFFSYSAKDNSAGRYLRKIWHIGKIFLGSILVYLVWNFVYIGSDWNKYFLWLKHVFSLQNFIELIIFGDTTDLCAVLWFLPTLMMCYVLMLGLRKIQHKNVFLVLSLLMMAGRLIFPGVLYIMGADVPDVWRRGLFLALPFFFLGYYLRQIQAATKSAGLSGKKLLIWMLIGGILIVLEDLLFNNLCHVGRITSTGLYLGNCILAVCAFFYCLKNPGNTGIAWITNLGKEGSLYVYILHPVILYVSEVYIFQSRTGIQGILKPLLVCVVTLAVAGAISFVRRKCRKKREKQ